MATDYTDKIEQVQAFEEKFGVGFEGLYAIVTEDEDDGPYRVIVRGEIHARTKNSKIKESLDIVLCLYDDKGRVIGKGDHYLGDESFFVFDVFEIDLFDVPVLPARLKLFPKVS